MIGPRAGAYRGMLHGVDRLRESQAAACYPRRRRAVADIATPHPRAFRAILNDGLGECASHGRTDRPSPRPERGAGLARGYSTPLHPPTQGLRTLGKPARGAFVLPATHDRGLALGTHQRSYRAPLEPIDQGTSSLEPDKGLSHPLTTRRRLSRPGTHDQSLRALDDAQAAFMPLHPDEGIPLDPAAGAIRQKGGALDR